jgi:hypothetical protein
MTSPLPPTEDQLPGDYIHHVQFKLTDEGHRVTSCGFILPEGWPPQQGLITCPACRHEMVRQSAAAPMLE